MFWVVRLEATITKQNIVVVMVATPAFGVAIIPIRLIIVSALVREATPTVIHLVSVANERQQV